MKEDLAASIGQLEIEQIEDVDLSHSTVEIEALQQSVAMLADVTVNVNEEYKHLSKA